MRVFQAPVYGYDAEVDISAADADVTGCVGLHVSGAGGLVKVTYKNGQSGELYINLGDAYLAEIVTVVKTGTTATGIRKLMP